MNFDDIKIGMVFDPKFVGYIHLIYDKWKSDVKSHDGLYILDIPPSMDMDIDWHQMKRRSWDKAPGGRPKDTWELITKKSHKRKVIKVVFKEIARFLGE